MKSVAEAETSQEISGARAELDAFVHAVSHDLRTPIRSIRGFGQILKEDHYDHLDAEGKDALDRMIGATTKLSDMLEGLLSYSRLAQRPVRLQQLDITSLASEAWDQLANEISCRTSTLDVAPGLQGLADRELLRSALHELLGNACKFSSGSTGTIQIAEVGGSFFIRDHGPGFDSSADERIFEPFERLNGDKYRGVGMGLANVKRIFGMIGGHVWAEGEPGKGAAFWFTLPSAIPDDEMSL